MTLILRRLSKTSSSLHSPPSPTYQLRPASFDATAVKFVRDRGLDHAVERERNLRPLINLKNLLKWEPSKSLPISVISQQRDSLQIPLRPIEFIRRYPSVFEEFIPGSIAIHPHVKLKDEVLELDAEEQLIYQSESFRKDAAERVLKLLMISRANKVPLAVLDKLTWDMGLPWDFVQSIVPEFPDYFRVLGNGDFGTSLYRSDKAGVLELVCWSNEHAVSAIEKKGAPIVFPMNFSKGFEMDKKFKKWVDDWQRLPYVSPYEDGSHLGPQTGESDKWAVAVLHELLNLFASRKTEKENLLCVGEFLSIRSRFKRALLNHPGIFYLSNKLGTYTVVLKEAFKRGSLVEEHPMMAMRNRYIHLMNTVKEEKKAVSGSSSSNNKKDQRASASKEQVEAEDQREKDNGACDLSASEFEEDDDDDDVDEDEDVRQSGAHRNVLMRRGRANWERDSNTRGRSINPARKRIDRRRVSEEDEDVRQSDAHMNVSARRGRANQERDSNTRGRSIGSSTGKGMGRRQLRGEDGYVRQSDNRRKVSASWGGRGNQERESNTRDRSISSPAGKRMESRRQFRESESTRSSGRQESRRRGDKPRKRWSEERSTNVASC